MQRAAAHGTARLVDREQRRPVPDRRARQQLAVLAPVRAPERTRGLHRPVAGYVHRRGTGGAAPRKQQDNQRHAGRAVDASSHRPGGFRSSIGPPVFPSAVCAAATVNRFASQIRHSACFARNVRRSLRFRWLVRRHRNSAAVFIARRICLQAEGGKTVAGGGPRISGSLRQLLWILGGCPNGREHESDAHSRSPHRTQRQPLKKRVAERSPRDARLHSAPDTWRMPLT